MSSKTALSSKSDNQIQTFTVDTLDVRGRVARFGLILDTLLKRHKYPDIVARAVGEAVVLTALLGDSLKLQEGGSFQLQAQTQGVVNLIVADFFYPGKIRAYARYDADALSKIDQSNISIMDILGEGILALTIDPGGHLHQYQGVVTLDQTGFQGAANRYFEQSEQIPTEVRLAVAQLFENGQKCYRAGGIIVQFLPSSATAGVNETETERKDDDFFVTFDRSPEDLWDEAHILMRTIQDHELVDPDLTSEKLLYRLYHEQGVTVFPAHSIQEGCTCSRERIMNMFKNFSKQEHLDLVGNKGCIEVKCEFCSRLYEFKPDELSSSDEKKEVKTD